MRAGNIIALAAVVDYANAIKFYEPEDVGEWYWSNGPLTQTQSDLLQEFIDSPTRVAQYN